MNLGSASIIVFFAAFIAVINLGVAGLLEFHTTVAAACSILVGALGFYLWLILEHDA